MGGILKAMEYYGFLYFVTCHNLLKLYFEIKIIMSCAYKLCSQIVELCIMYIVHG